MSKKLHPLYSYTKNKLIYNDFDLGTILKKISGPFYLYSLDAVTKNIQNFRHNFHLKGLDNLLLCYALKANPNAQILSHVRKLGAGADIVSQGELAAAINAGISPDKIVFSGVGKTQEEITRALNSGPRGIRAFNVESLEELSMIAQLAKAQKKIARVAFRINPSIKAPTHHLISTGNKSHKFGILPADILSVLPLLKNNSVYKKHLNFVGLSVHIGSQLLTFKASKQAFQIMANLSNKIVQTTKRPLEFLDVGGGLGIGYYHKDRPEIPFSSYANAVYQGLASYREKHPDVQIICEPGRSIVGNAGIFITKVVRVKKSGPYTFLVVDGGMNDFARPALYQAHHEIYPLLKRPGKLIRANIVGPVCETSDCFAEGRQITPTLVDDYLAIADTGAYGHSMASFYNLRNLPAEVVIDQK